MTHTRLDPELQGGSALDAPARRAFTGSLLIEGQDDDDVIGALRLAELLARRDQVNAHVLTLVAPLPFTVSLLTGADPAPLDEGRRQEQLARMRQRVHQTVGQSAHFSTSAELGSPASTIARAAGERGAALIIVGLGAQGAPGRAASEDAALQEARMAGVPVLVVPPNFDALPRRALVAMDFGEASLSAARAALLTLASGGTLMLAHVAPDVDFRKLGKEGWGEIYAEGVAGLFRRLLPALRSAGDVEVETAIVHADLIVVGSSGAGRVPRYIFGSVAEAILRGASCPVFHVVATEDAGDDDAYGFPTSVSPS